MGGFSTIVRGKPISFIKLSSCFLLVAIVLYLNELYKMIITKSTNKAIKPKMQTAYPISLRSYLSAFIDALRYKLMKGEG